MSAHDAHLRVLYEPFIGGEWQPASGGTYDVMEPGSGKALTKAGLGEAADIDSAVAAAAAAADEWGQLPALKRGRILGKVAQALRASVDWLAELESRNAGKVIQHARADVLSAAQYFEFYGGLAPGLEGETVPAPRAGVFTYTTREPYGVTGHILPWNFPLVVAARSVAPALAAGNSAVVKPAEETPISCLALAELASTCGLPAGVLNVVPGFGAAGAALASHPGVPRLTFTGSVETGKVVLAAAASHLCEVTVELGGKSPHIIFADADLERAARDAVFGIATHAGQICSAGSRLLIEGAVHDEVLGEVAGVIGGITAEDPLNGGPMGPLISGDQRDRVLRYVEAGSAEGARIRAAGSTPQGDGGFFVAPVVFDRVRPEMQIAREEIFGPVLAVTPFESESEAVRIANDSSYGLAAGIWTRDIDRAMRMANRLQAGTVYVNGYYGAGLELPFGGLKDSGYGRENGRQALAAYTTLKSVAISYVTDA